MLDDFARHPGFFSLAIGWGVVAVIWMIYRYKRDQEMADIDYATLDILWKIWGGE
jgi:hypothetical protein